MGLGKLYDASYTKISEEEIPNPINQLSYGYPNPFNPEITIIFKLASDYINPQIEIFNLKGQLVRRYIIEETSGENSIVWNGKDTDDNDVSSGVYFYALKNNGQVLETRKITLLK